MKKKFLIVIMALVLALIPAFGLGGCGGGEAAACTVTVVGGTLSDGKTEGKFDKGTEVTVTATVPADKEFVNWTEGQTILSTSQSYTFKVEYDITVTANYKAVSVTGTKVWILEAEAMNLDNYAGVGYSGGGQGAGAIQGVNDAGLSQEAKDSLNKLGSDGKAYNSGYFLGFFNGDGTSFKFTFESSDDEEDVTLTLRLGSEHGDMMFDPTILTIRVNGVDLDYEPFTVTGGQGSFGVFKDYTLSTKISLKKNTLTGNDDLCSSTGEVVIPRPIRVQNTVELVLHTNNYWTDGTNSTGGPGIDCIKLECKSTISFVDYWLGGWPEDFEEDPDGGEPFIIEREGYVNNEE